MNLPVMTTGGLPEDSPANAVSESTVDITPDPVMMDTIAPKVVEALKTVFDPEIPVDIYELGLIYKVDIQDDRAVNVDMTLTTPNCPAAAELPMMVENAVASVAGVGPVKVEIVWDPPWDPSRMSDEARLVLNMW
jgi:FeS assembly SUF system protein